MITSEIILNIHPYNNYQKICLFFNVRVVSNLNLCSKTYIKLSKNYVKIYRYRYSKVCNFCQKMYSNVFCRNNLLKNGSITETVAPIRYLLLNVCGFVE